QSHGNYKFDFNVKDAQGHTQNRWETTDAHNVRKGGYSFTDPDGRFRQVQYEADRHGFRVLVRTNEPGAITHFPDHAAIIREVPPVQVKQVSAAVDRPRDHRFMPRSQSTTCRWCIRFQQSSRTLLNHLLFGKYQSLTREAMSMDH
ncbi:unnamed protein product, partial [Ixodes hexagonus]